MLLLNTGEAASRFGEPVHRLERGTIGERGELAYLSAWNWRCGCRGELIGEALMQLDCCERHRTAA
ncbi:MAG: hypothetical protein ABR508_06725 [Candidatus Baltobacteraceae bacterium]